MIERAFAFAAGVDRELLLECPSSERIKHTAIGATIYLTAIFAFVSMLYALHRVLGESFLLIMASFGGALLWSVTIFTIDRLIVLSIRKSDHWLKNLGIAMPRLLLAGLISILIATPLELKIFADRIALERQTKQDEELRKGRGTVRETFGLPELEKTSSALEAQQQQLIAALAAEPTTDIYERLKTELDTASNERQAYQKSSETRLGAIANELRIVNATLGTVNREIGSSRRELQQSELRREDTSGARARIAELGAQRSRLLTRIEQLTAEVERISFRRTEFATAETRAAAALRAERDRHEATLREGIQNLTSRAGDVKKTIADRTIAARPRLDQSQQAIARGLGENLIAEVESLGDLTARHKTIWWAALLLQLAFLMVETAPVLAKLFSRRGPYDDLVHIQELEFSERGRAVEELYRRSDFEFFRERAAMEAEESTHRRSMDHALKGFTYAANRLDEYIQRHHDAARSVARASASEHTASIGGKLVETLESASSRFFAAILRALKSRRSDADT